MTVLFVLLLLLQRSGQVSNLVTAINSDPPQNVLEARAWVMALNNAISPAGSDPPPSQDANTIYAAPDGVAGIPSFRSLVSDDIPNLAASKFTSGVFVNALIDWANPVAIGTGTPVAGVFTQLILNGALELNDFQNISGASGTFGNTVSFGVISGGLSGVTLPVAATGSGKFFLVKNISGGARTVNRQGSDVIYNNGGTSSVTSFSLPNTEWRLLISDGVLTWYAIG